MNEISMHYIQSLYPEQELEHISWCTTNKHINNRTCVDYTVNLYLITIMYADFRDYLDLGKIITNQNSLKTNLLQSNTKLLHQLEFLTVDIKQLNRILFKNKEQELKRVIANKFKINLDEAEQLIGWSAGIVILGMYQQMMVEKINLSGLIETIRKNKTYLKTKMDETSWQYIYEISHNNRRRTKSYTRGKPKKDDKSLFYALTIGSILIVMYLLLSVLKK
ncbi:MAG: hypothetical protein ACR2IL_05255 [Chitinophagaceae bacterium]